MHQMLLADCINLSISDNKLFAKVKNYSTTQSSAAPSKSLTISTVAFSSQE